MATLLLSIQIHRSSEPLTILISCFTSTLSSAGGTLVSLQMDRQRQQNSGAQDEELYLEESLRYLGTARVGLSGLQSDAVDFGRRFDERHVSALISSTELADAVKRSNISLEALRAGGTPPKLIIPATNPLKCNDGLHRLAAAREQPRNGEDWWVVKLYSDGVWCIQRSCSPSLTTAICRS
jgi:hypothetical protein